MQNLKEGLLSPSFSHIYVEEEAFNYELTKDIIEKFKSSNIIKINHYKDVFSRANQDFTLQKNSPKLILAVKKNKLIYKGARVCESFGNEHFYYTSTMMNCIYDCEYCYLQGMYTSANIVIFVNIEDYLKELKELLLKFPVYLCVSYDTDILAFEGITSFAKRWIEFTRENNNLIIEIRTKSANFNLCLENGINENVVFAWTLSPEAIINKYEHKTPNLQKRIESLLSAIDKNARVRICIDPVIYIDNFEEVYGEFIDEIFDKIPSDKMSDISIGVFRVSKDYLKKMKKNRSSLVLSYPYETLDGVCTYDNLLREKMIDYIKNKLLKYVPSEKIYI